MVSDRHHWYISTHSWTNWYKESPAKPWLHRPKTPHHPPHHTPTFTFTLSSPHTLTSPHHPQHTCHLTSFCRGWLSQSRNAWVVASVSTESVWTLTPAGKQDVRLQNVHVNTQLIMWLSCEHGVRNCMGSFYLVSITLAVTLLTEVLQEAD